MTNIKAKLDVSMVKAQNRRLVFEEIANRAPTTRLAIAHNTRLSAGTVKTLIEELIEYGVVREAKTARSAVGRRPNQVEFVPEARKILCLDLATKNPSFALKDLSLKTEVSSGGLPSRSRLRTGESYEQYIRSFLEETRKALSPGDGRNLIGVGVSVPGPYRAEEDRVSCKLIPEIGGMRVGSLVSEYFPSFILIDHDVKLAASSEVRLIPDFERKTILYLYLDEGVGSAIAINGTIFGGAREFAGEIGQMTGGGETNLERQVSWNSFVGRLLGADAASGRGETEVDRELKEMYEGENKNIESELDSVTSAVALALANVIFVLNPHEIIVSGRYNLFGSGFVQSLEKKAGAYLLSEMREGLVFRMSRYLEKGSLLGAAGMIRDRWLTSSRFRGEV